MYGFGFMYGCIGARADKQQARSSRVMATFARCIGRVPALTDQVRPP